MKTDLSHYDQFSCLILFIPNFEWFHLFVLSENNYSKPCIVLIFQYQETL
jgi:hypothetical protein